MGQSNRKGSKQKSAAFSAKAMFEHLPKGPPRILTGAVRPHDADPAVFLLRTSHMSLEWIQVSERVVERYEHLGHTIMEGIRYPVVKLFLMRPTSEEGEIFLHAMTMPAGRLVSLPALEALNPAAATQAEPLAGRRCVYDAGLGYDVYEGTTIPC